MLKRKLFSRFSRKKRIEGKIVPADGGDKFFPLCFYSVPGVFVKTDKSVSSA